MATTQSKVFEFPPGSTAATIDTLVEAWITAVTPLTRIGQGKSVVLVDGRIIHAIFYTVA
jgi:hypothetical protein